MELEIKQAPGLSQLQNQGNFSNLGRHLALKAYFAYFQQVHSFVK